MITGVRMMIKVDARGFGCPTPVIMTKNAIEEAKDEEVLTIVDNEVAKENVKRLAEKLNYQTSVKENGNNYYITITKKVTEKADIKRAVAPTGDWVLLITSDRMGEGAETLGRILIKGYFYALTETKPYPKSILFINSGVNLTTEGSEILEYLQLLESNGVEILSCGTCLDFYDLKSKLSVGKITNMYTIVEKMNEVLKVVRI